MTRRYTFLEEALNAREQAGNKRMLRNPEGLIDFSSNDYMGLATNVDLKRRIDTSYRSSNHSIGGTGSRLISGNHEQYELTELYLTELLGGACLIFNSGYVANQGLIAAVAGKGDTIIYDQLAHVCIKEGAWLSKADSFSFRHNDLNDLKRRLSTASGNTFVVTETVFSMDGDKAPVEEILALCEEHGAHLIVDEAHSTGCFGQGGKGMIAEMGLTDRVFATVLTFGKAMGVHGACVVGTETLREYLINFCRTFIYTTSLPPHALSSIYESFCYLAQEGESLQQQLRDRIAFFKRLMKDELGREAMSDTAIQPIIIPGNEKCKQVAKGLHRDGYDVKAILAPTVKAGEERLRISIHANNTEEEIAGLIRSLKIHL